MAVVLIFEREKETKGTVRYKESVESEGDSVVVGTLYVRKPAVAEHQFADKLRVTIENA